MVGDFNQHSLMWDKHQVEDDRGKALETWAEQTGMIAANSGESTKCISNSAPDISFYYESWSGLMDWCILEDHCSDHLPIQLSFTAGVPIPRCAPPKWSYRTADWAKFTAHIMDHYDRCMKHSCRA